MTPLLALGSYLAVHLFQWFSYAFIYSYTSLFIIIVTEALIPTSLLHSLIKLVSQLSIYVIVFWKLPTLLRQLM